ncbi:peptidoglycan DD-metalloendopeptidase family protein [Thiomicrorhabdus sp. Kp2]|uniref:peptidoglycan DD-metalloendopeptidase family protein n=1 Tax=Thiomicrorhabdus sp. Kp2 TaxID=1123518 RepID=UPI000594FB8D|nr:M23 family metallopeptidase [Thiomicrorhabdus sp. Kp2]
MPLIQLQRLSHSVIFIVFFTLLGACSSPIKYEARNGSSQANTSYKSSAGQSNHSCRSPYVVESGDTLSGIAYQCDINMSDIAKINHLLPPYIIYVKQELVLPMNQSLSAESVTEATPTVAVDSKQSNSTSLDKKEPHSSIKISEKSHSEGVQDTKEVSAKALTRTENQSLKTSIKTSKSKKWQWPMHKGLSYKYLRDNAGLSILEIYGVPGQQVKAVAPGKVVYAGNGIINYGWMLVIKHDNDYMSIYAHNSALLVKEGDGVDAGDVVASMGATGNTKRPKLYVEARYQGRKIDIKKVLKQ